MENRAYALMTGLFLIGIVAAIVVAAQWLGGDQTVRVPYRVVATQPVTGLNPQAQVRYRGIGVGRVTAINLDPKDARRILIDTEVDGLSVETFVLHPPGSSEPSRAVRDGR